MRLLVVLMLAMMALAGCTEAPTTDDAVIGPDDPYAPSDAPLEKPTAEEADPDVPVEGSADVEKTAQEKMKVHPLLIEVTPELRDGAAEVVIPAGSYRIIRLVYDTHVWGEEEPWDGDADTMVGMAWELEGEGTFMRAFGFEPSSFADDRTIRPSISFYSVEGAGWAASSTSSSCSGCGDEVPAHELAYLLGSEASGIVLRMGVLEDWDAEVLWDRDPVPVRADAQTADAFTGSAVRLFYLAQEHRGVSGIMEAEWDDALPTATGVERSSRFTAEAEVAEPGIFTFDFRTQEAVGHDSWSYDLETGGPSGSWESEWVHTAYSRHAAATGVVWPPQAGYQGNVPAGPVSMEAERTFTGQSDPIGPAFPSYESASIGHAGIDLDGLYGWDTERPMYPDDGSGALHCTMGSMQPVQVCHGDRTVAGLIGHGAAGP